MNPVFGKIRELVCFSHVRWDSHFQRPHHLLTRFARSLRVFFVEPPVFHASGDYLNVQTTPEGIIVLAPHLIQDHARADVTYRLHDLFFDYFQREIVSDYMFWYYDPLALSYTREFNAQFVVYDCVNVLPAFRKGQAELKELDAELTGRADVVFAAGQSLYELKKKKHPRTYLFSGGVDMKHFRSAREASYDPPDQDSIPHPRLGFFGVVDERLDKELLESVARLRPNWNFIILGPVENIDPLSLPAFNNIHYLGRKSYHELPHYLSGWDIAIIPFAHAESTRYASPLKTAEYLAGGKPVISTPIIDVIRPYGNKGLVRIAGTPDEFVKVADETLQEEDRSEWLGKVDYHLANFSWDNTCNEMLHIVRTTLVGKPSANVTNVNREAF